MADEKPYVFLPVDQMIQVLSEQDRAILEGVFADGHRLLDLIKRAEACGMQVQERLQAHHGAQDYARRMHAHFFPAVINTESD